MTIRTRLALALLAIGIVLVVPLTLSLLSLRELRATAVALRDGEFAGSLLLGRLRSSVEEVRERELALLYVPDSVEINRPRMDSAVARVAARADSLESFQLDQEAARVQAAVAAINAAVTREYEAVRAGNAARADSLSAREVQPALARLTQWVRAAESTLRERTRERVATAAMQTADATKVAAASLAIAILLASIIAIAITRSISRPVSDLDRGMRAVAEGDFDRPLSISAQRTDEFGRLATSYRQMAAQLAELDKLKAEFVSVASHELKTPINVIMGYVQLLEEGMYGPVTPQQREVLRTLESQCAGLTRLVRQLLDVSRFQAGGGKLDPRPVPFLHFLDELERGFAVLAHQRGVAFRVVRAPDLPAEVVWDLDRMNEVLGNLLSNAFKFTSRGGRVELHVDATDDSISMEVRDSGAGIPQDQLPFIFRKFYQADNQSAADAAGTGLGLAIAKEIVEAHEGSIAAESTPGEGTTFLLTMPIRAATGRRTAPQRPVLEAAT